MLRTVHVFVLVAFFGVGLAACGSDTTVSPGVPACDGGADCALDDVTVCKAVTCSGHGVCGEVSGRALCACDPGYQAVEETLCVADAPGACEGVTCSGHGVCGEVSGRALCACDPGYQAVEEALCVADTPGVCEGVTCSGRGVCGDDGGVALCSCDPGYHVVEDTRCVADGGRFTRANGIVTDSSTGLQWQDTPHTAADRAAYNSSTDEAGRALRWIHASAYCESLVLEGTGWRLATISELEGIVDSSRSNPAIYPALLNCESLGYWSGTPAPNGAYGVGFAGGATHQCGTNHLAKLVRCVR